MKDINMTNIQKKKMGMKLKMARLNRRLTLEELATAVNMSVESLERFENGDFEIFDDSPDFIN